MSRYHLIAKPKYENFVDSIPLHQQYELDFSDIQPTFPGYYSVRIPFKPNDDYWISITTVMEEVHKIIFQLAKFKMTNWVIMVPSESSTEFTDRTFEILFQDQNQALTFRLSF